MPFIDLNKNISENFNENTFDGILYYNYKTFYSPKLRFEIIQL